MIVENPELLGFGWSSSIVKYMKDAGKGTIEGKNINDSLVKTLQKQYSMLMYSGLKPPKYKSKSGYLVTWEKDAYTIAKRLSEKVGTSLIKTLNFLQALVYLQSIGKIPFKLYDPIQFEKTKKFLGSKTFLSKFGKSLRSIVPVTILGLSAIGLYIYKQEKKQ